MNDRMDIYQARIKNLQKWLRDHALQFLLLPRNDRYFNEFLAPQSERIAWLTNFTGSYAFVCLTQDECMLWSDARYDIQMREQTPNNVTCHLSTELRIEDWLQSKIQNTDIIAFPQWQISIKYYQNLHAVIAQTGAVLQGLEENPIDGFWHDRPAAPLGIAELFPEEFCGTDASTKISWMRKSLDKKKCGAVFIADVTMTAWLLNLRGSDIPFCPVNLAYLIIHRTNVFLLINPEKMTPEIMDYCQKHQIQLRDETALDGIIADIPEKNWLIDPVSTAIAVKTRLQDNHCQLHESPMPLEQIRSRKNPNEIRAMKDAHIADGVAMVKFLHWLETQTQTDELTIMSRLEGFRAENPDYRGPSFTTIAGFAKNGAIIHYHSDEHSNHTSRGGALLLLDSGGQYRNGTTDITRTVAFGVIHDDAVKTDFTLVLKSHIRLAMLNFPQNTNGIQLDAICRAALWQHHKNYNHGTGHGVGVYLGVHEGNHHLSPRCDLPIKSGMILSNEPGIYHEGRYGIRLENLIVAEQSPQNSEWLQFQTITLCPLDKSLIKKDLLENSEIQWLNDYHAQLKHTLMPHLCDTNVLHWLDTATQPL